MESLEVLFRNIEIDGKMKDAKIRALAVIKVSRFEHFAALRALQTPRMP